MNTIWRKATLLLTASQLLFCIHLTMAQEATLPIYTGNDLGVVYTPTATQITIYAPQAEAARLNLYRSGDGGTAYANPAMQKAAQGTWQITLPGNQAGVFYTVQTRYKGSWSNEVTDPYAKAVGVNGNRVQIIDFASTNPPGWNQDQSPQYTSNNTMQDAVIYELHLRDLSLHPTAGITNKGKYKGLTEINTRNPQGLTTGLSHIKELGVTHVHLLPVFDYNSIDETTLNKNNYNWGYDPKNYNAPEGSYSRNPYDPKVRIKEFKELVAALHKAGLRVVMDVVYNHTALSGTSNFHQLVPNYYYRMKPDGSFADASACGNETASEQPMMRKFMVESLVHWAKEYHIDGFRFDLMAIHDITTMNEIAAALRNIKPDILIYGEGWAASAPQLPQAEIALKRNVGKLNGVAVFSDDIRDAIKGYVFEEEAKGFVNGNPAMTETIKFGIVGALPHPQVDMSKAFYDKVPYATAPGQVVNYVDCHDNLTLWDKLSKSAHDAGFAERKAMQELAYGLVLTSQGIPFVHAGSEFLRSKKGVENSYQSPDSINAIDWSLKTKNNSTFQFMKALIQLRKAHPLFRLQTTAAVQQQLQFVNVPEGAIAYTIERVNEKDTWKKALIICNPLSTSLSLPKQVGAWKLALSNQAKGHAQQQQVISVPPRSFSIYYL